jgi:hypothetical protein
MKRCPQAAQASHGTGMSTCETSTLRGQLLPGAVLSRCVPGNPRLDCVGPRHSDERFGLIVLERGKEVVGLVGRFGRQDAGQQPHCVPIITTRHGQCVPLAEIIFGHPQPSLKYAVRVYKSERT